MKPNSGYSMSRNQLNIRVSDELEELLDISDRLHVLFRGRLSPSIPRREATDTVIGAWMTGEFGSAPAAPAEGTFQ